MDLQGEKPPVPDDKINTKPVQEKTPPFTSIKDLLLRKKHEDLQKQDSEELRKARQKIVDSQSDLEEQINQGKSTGNNGAYPFNTGITIDTFITSLSP